jgi:hypothetical protein
LPAQEFPHWVDNTRVMLEQMRRPKAVSRL